MLRLLAWAPSDFLQIVKKAADEPSPAAGSTSESKENNASSNMKKLTPKSHDSAKGGKPSEARAEGKGSSPRATNSRATAMKEAGESHGKGERKGREGRSDSKNHDGKPRGRKSSAGSAGGAEDGVWAKETLPELPAGETR